MSNIKLELLELLATEISMEKAEKLIESLKKKKIKINTKIKETFVVTVSVFKENILVESFDVPSSLFDNPYAYITHLISE